MSRNRFQINVDNPTHITFHIKRSQLIWSGVSWTPPLWDVPLMAHQEAAQRETLEWLCECHWPGNALGSPRKLEEGVSLLKLLPQWPSTEAEEDGWWELESLTWCLRLFTNGAAMEYDSQVMVLPPHFQRVKTMGSMQTTILPLFHWTWSFFSMVYITWGQLGRNAHPYANLKMKRA